MSTQARNKPVWKATAWGTLALALTACNGGGGGNGGEPVPLADGGFNKTVAGAIANGNSFPFAGDYDIKTQHLYYADDVNGAGDIAALRLKRDTATAAPISCPDFTVRLGHTNLSTLTTIFANNVEQGQGSLVTAVDNIVFEIPAGAAGEWIDIPLSTPFHYNGVDNLVVEFETASSCDVDQAVSVDSVAGRRAYRAAVDATPGVVDHNPDLAAAVDGQHYHMQFDFNGGDDGLAFGGASTNFWPFSLETPKVQMLYSAADIDGSGPVTGVAFRLAQTSVAADYIYSVRLGHSSLDALATGPFDANFDVDGSTLVADGATWSLPAGIPAGEWVWLPVPDGQFTYNGSDNLLVEIAVSSGTADTRLRVTDAAYNVRAGGENGGYMDTDATWSDNTQYDMNLRFNGGTMGVITDDSLGTNAPFGGNGKHQALYTADRLGTAGEITSVACRLDAATVETTYEDIEITLGHTELMALTTTFADNMVDATLVRDGSFTVPAGLVSGDWVEIPLTTPFAYDGERNLVVQMVNRGAVPVSYTCFAGNDIGPYFVGSLNSGAVTGIVGTYGVDLMLGYERY